MYLNLDTSESDDELFNEWKNKIIRTSLAKSSLLKIKKISGTHFLNKAKVQLLGDFMLLHSVNALFINAELTPLQTRNLERYAKIMTFVLGCCIVSLITKTYFLVAKVLIRGWNPTSILRLLHQLRVM